MQHAPFEHRATVDPCADPAALTRALDAQLARRPTDRVVHADAFGIVYRAEPRWYLAVAFGATLGGGILGHVLASHAPVARWAPHVLAALMDLTAVVAMASLAVGLLVRVEVVADGSAVVHRTWFGRRLWRTARVPGDELTAVLVAGAPGRRRVTLVGARNAERLRVFRESFIDPPALARWQADTLALIASRAATWRA